MKILKFAALILLLLILSSCVEVEPPNVTYLDHALQNITLEGFDAIFFFEASNPNPVNIAIKKYSYRIFLNGEEFLSDEKKGFELPASGKKKFEIGSRITYQNILKTGTSVIGTLLSGGQEIPYKIEGSLSGEVAGMMITAPINAQGTIKVTIPKK